MSSVKKAVILLSGGLDSATVLALARSRGYACYCLSFVYGQRHDAEVDYAKGIAERLGASAHRIATIDLSPTCNARLYVMSPSLLFGI